MKGVQEGERERRASQGKLLDYHFNTGGERGIPPYSPWLAHRWREDFSIFSYILVVDRIDFFLFQCLNDRVVSLPYDPEETFI